jgi:hypothetical protein
MAQLLRVQHFMLTKDGCGAGLGQSVTHLIFWRR